MTRLLPLSVIMYGVCMFVCVCVCVSVCLSVCPSVRPSACLPVCLSVYKGREREMLFCPSTCLPAYLPSCLSVSLSICLSVCLSICLYIKRERENLCLFQCVCFVYAQNTWLTIKKKIYIILNDRSLSKCMINTSF